MHGVASPQVEGLAFPFFGLHEVSVDAFLQPVKGPLVADGAVENARAYSFTAITFAVGEQQERQSGRHRQ